jgi:methyl-accepting chemotaxis protein
MFSAVEILVAYGRLATQTIFGRRGDYIVGNLKIGVRLGAAFAIVIIIMFMIGMVAVLRLSTLDDSITILVNDKYPKVIMLQEVKDHLNVIARGLRNMILLDNPEESRKEEKRVTDALKGIDKVIAELEKVVKSDTGKAQLKSLTEAKDAGTQAYMSALKTIESGDKEMARNELLTTVRKAQTAYFAALDKMVEHQSSEVKSIGMEADHYASQSKTIIICLLCVAVILAAILALMIVRSITNPVADLLAANEKLADGDLTVTIKTTGRDEIGQLADSSRRMVESLRQLISRVADTSGEIASASNQLRSTAEQIATAAEEVASQTSTVATASEEMAATSGDIAQNCAMAAESSRQSSDSATRGGAVVQETIAGMVKIAERVKNSAQTVESLGTRSEQIGQIIGTIEDIADQTNLLALNAAIEAARAGEQGRGFAVVADEVRALAERTSRATREIGDMIKGIQSETKAAVRVMEEGVAEVEKGAMSSQQSGKALDMILQQIGEVSMQINQIATAAEEQTATTSEITMNVQQVTDVVHQTARGASETATAAAQLSSSAETLQNLVRQFKL